MTCAVPSAAAQGRHEEGRAQMIGEWQKSAGPTGSPSSTPTGSDRGPDAPVRRALDGLYDAAAWPRRCSWWACSSWCSRACSGACFGFNLPGLGRLRRLLHGRRGLPRAGAHAQARRAHPRHACSSSASSRGSDARSSSGATAAGSFFCVVLAVLRAAGAGSPTSSTTSRRATTRRRCGSRSSRWRRRRRARRRDARRLRLHLSRAATRGVPIGEGRLKLME
jgi:hypothetical protein